MADALVFERARAQQQQQQKHKQNSVAVDDHEKQKISVRCLLYLRDKNALIKQKLNSCQRRRQRQQLLSTNANATTTTLSAADWLCASAAAEIQQQQQLTCTKQQQEEEAEKELRREGESEAKTKTETTFWEKFTILRKIHKNNNKNKNNSNKKIPYHWKNLVYKFGMNFFKTNRGGYFILKLTKFCLIIILLMSLLATLTKIAQQVNCVELSKSLSSTTTTTIQRDNNNNKKMPTTKNERKKIVSNMEIYLENRTTTTTSTTKIENETKNNNNNHTYSQFFFSSKNVNDKRNSSSSSTSSSSHISFLSNNNNNRKNVNKSIEEIEIEQSERRYHRRRRRRALISTNTQKTTTTTKAFDNFKRLPPTNQQQSRTVNSSSKDNNLDAAASAKVNVLDIAQLTKLVMEGLGLEKLPDMQKVNISQQEYTSKYMEYLHRLQMHQQEEGGDNGLSPTLFTITVNSTLDITAKTKRWQLRRKRDVKDLFVHRHRRRQRHSARRDGGGGGVGDMTTILLKFPFNDNVAQLRANGIEEANIRLMIMYSPSLAMKRNGNGKQQSRKRKPPPHKNKNDMCNGNAEMNQTAFADKKFVPKKRTQSHLLNLKVFHNGFSNKKRKLLDTRKIRFESTESDNEDDTRSQWLDFDVTAAVRHWLERNISNNPTPQSQSLGLEVQCDNCKRIGARILNDVSSSQHVDADDREASKFQLVPVLNIIGREIGMRQQMLHAVNEDATAVYGEQQQTEAKYRKGNNCYKPHQRCCRRRLDIVFKEIKGFEFIIQPKVFDAGYCEGRCPPRHNPAHHHALLQSLIWKQDHKRAPRPCCVPSKLVKLEVLHVDEKDSEKLKISTWSDMQVVECACA